MVTPGARRASVRYLQEKYSVSERRACRATGYHRSMVRYRSRRPDDTELRQDINDLALKFPRNGYLQLHDRLARSGKRHNRKKIYRIYREEGLQVPKRKKKRSRSQPRSPGEAEHPERALVDGLRQRLLARRPTAPLPERP